MLLLESPPQEYQPNPVGRPPFEPDATQRKMVEELAACGLNVHAMARVVGISTHTLRKAFKKELTSGRVAIVHKTFGNMVKIANRENGGFAAVGAGKLVLEIMARTGIMVDPDEMREYAKPPIRTIKIIAVGGEDTEKAVLPSQPGQV